MYITSGILGASAVIGTASTGLGVGAVSAHGLAATGVSLLWMLLAAFALLGAGLALLRVLPRRQA